MPPHAPFFLTPTTQARFINLSLNVKIYLEKIIYSTGILNDCVDYFVPIVLKPLSAECHVVMDQSSDIVLDTPKVKFCTISNSILLGYYVYSHLAGTVFILLGTG